MVGISPKEAAVREYIHNNHRGEPEMVYTIRWQVP